VIGLQSSHSLEQAASHFLQLIRPRTSHVPRSVISVIELAEQAAGCDARPTFLSAARYDVFIRMGIGDSSRK
jgi:hypothetical protein